MLSLSSSAISMPAKMNVSEGLTGAGHFGSANQSPIADCEQQIVIAKYLA